MKNQSVTFILATGGFYGNWAKADSIKEAAIKLHNEGAKKSAQVRLTIVLGDTGAFIDSYNGINYGGSAAPEAWYIPSQYIGKLSQLMNYPSLPLP